MSVPAPSLDDAAPHVLVVDDDTRIRDLLGRFLGENGYRVSTAASAAEARGHMARFAYDLLILDVMMPGETGFDLARAVRKVSDVPILMLTARGETSDRIEGLEIGADDYLAKPFDPRELLLRMSSVLRRIAAPAEPESRGGAEVRFGSFTFHPGRGELRRGDTALRITERERQMLTLLAERGGDGASRLELAGDDSVGERAVDVQINRLRRKIEADPANPLLLQTVRGKGYRLMVEA
jgi:two-component system, OmpR family, phosphate regulon response regulator OmpR